MNPFLVHLFTFTGEVALTRAIITAIIAVSFAINSQRRLGNPGEEGGTLVPGFYAILTHSRAKSRRESGVYSMGAVYASTRLDSNKLAAYGTFDMRVFTNRTDSVVGKLHIPMYAQGSYMPAGVYRVIPVPSHRPAVVCLLPHSSQCF